MYHQWQQRTNYTITIRKKCKNVNQFNSRHLPGLTGVGLAEVRPKINSKTEARTVFKAQAAISKLDIRI